MILLDDVEVLVVDDQSEARESVVAMLATRGARVSAAASAAEARRELGRRRPRIVVSDLLMPDEDGYQLIASVRIAAGDAPPIPFVALSAFGSPQDRRRARRAGYHAFLRKPASGDEIATAIRDTLEAAEAPPHDATAVESTEKLPRRVSPGNASLAERRRPEASEVMANRSSARLMNLALLSFHRATNGSIRVETPGGRMVAVFETFRLSGADQWQVVHVPGGLAPEEARLLFLDWSKGGRRCD